MAIMASHRRLAEHLEAQRAGHWRTETLVGDDLMGATVFIVGAGSIGVAVEARLAAFGPRFVRFRAPAA